MSDIMSPLKTDNLSSSSTNYLDLAISLEGSTTTIRALALKALLYQVSVYDWTTIANARLSKVSTVNHGV